MATCNSCVSFCTELAQLKGFFQELVCRLDKQDSQMSTILRMLFNIEGRLNSFPASDGRSDPKHKAAAPSTNVAFSFTARPVQSLAGAHSAISSDQNVADETSSSRAVRVAPPTKKVKLRKATAGVATSELRNDADSVVQRYVDDQPNATVSSSNHLCCDHGCPCGETTGSGHPPTSSTDSLGEAAALRRNTRLANSVTALTMQFSEQDKAGAHVSQRHLVGANKSSPHRRKRLGTLDTKEVMAAIISDEDNELVT